MQTTGRRVPVDAIYSELRQLAAAALQPDAVVRPGALVQQAWSRLGGDGHATDERTRCLSLGAIAVRQILSAEPVPERRVALGDAFAAAPAREILVADLDALLRQLERENAVLARLVQLRVFGDLSVEEATDALEISPAEGRAAWSEAGDWMLRELGAAGPS